MCHTLLHSICRAENVEDMIAGLGMPQTHTRQKEFERSNFTSSVLSAYAASSNQHWHLQYVPRHFLNSMKKVAKTAQYARSMEADHLNDVYSLNRSSRIQDILQCVVCMTIVQVRSL